MDSARIGRKIAFLGGGQMAEALIGGLLSGGACEPESLRAADPLQARRDLLKQRFGIQTGSDNRHAVAWADVIVLAVKPQMMAGVLEDVGPGLADRLVISIAAGIPIQSIAERVAPTARLIRAMPNTPAIVREGMTALAFGSGVTEADVAVGRSLFECVGRVAPVEERLMDAVTGLSGSGPAYVFLAIEALADGGVKMGLPRTIADLLAAQTVFGAARLVLQTAEHPAKLKDRVASPGGTTIAGLHVLEQGGLRAALMAAVEAATLRSRDLGR